MRWAELISTVWYHAWEMAQIYTCSQNQWFRNSFLVQKLDFLQHRQLYHLIYPTYWHLSLVKYQISSCEYDPQAWCNWFTPCLGFLLSTRRLATVSSDLILILRLFDKIPHKTLLHDIEWLLASWALVSCDVKCRFRWPQKLISLCAHRFIQTHEQPNRIL